MLVLLVMGVLDLARAHRVQIQLTNAARESYGGGDKIWSAGTATARVRSARAVLAATTFTE